MTHHRIMRECWLGSEDPISQACNHVMTLTARQHEGNSRLCSLPSRQPGANPVEKLQSCDGENQK